MRNLFVIILLALVVGFCGFFVVDQREVGIVYTSANSAKLYATGVHWKLPFAGDLNLVYINSRSANLTTTQQFTTKDGQNFNMSLVVNWQVVNPANYIRYLNANSSLAT